VQFEEYISAALASVRYRDFLAKGEGSGVIITGGSGSFSLSAAVSGHDRQHDAGGDASSAEDFNPLWVTEFKRTNAYEVWDRTTDPMLFDIVEPRSVPSPGYLARHVSNLQSCRLPILAADTRARTNPRSCLTSDCASLRAFKSSS
jgi:hypothetical protein